MYTWVDFAKHWYRFFLKTSYCKKKSTFKLVAFLLLKNGVKIAYEINGWFTLQCLLRKETTTGISFYVNWYTKVHGCDHNLRFLKIYLYLTFTIALLRYFQWSTKIWVLIVELNMEFEIKSSQFIVRLFQGFYTVFSVYLLKSQKPIVLSGKNHSNRKHTHYCSYIDNIYYHYLSIFLILSQK